MMKSIHEICEKNGLRYYIVGGTMLGAIRHHGFIPWDDDMDISMPRDDYEIFIHLSEDELPEWMEIHTPESSNYDLTASKVMDKTTTFIEARKDKNIVEGAYIDVFPLDGIGDNLTLSKFRMNLIQFITFMLRANQGTSNLNNIPKKLFATIAPHLDRKAMFLTLENYTTKYKYEKCKYVANTVGRYAQKEMTLRSYYGKPQLYQFENFEFYGVEKPDEFLKGVYGDYMKLPSESERKLKHHSYFNPNLPYRNYSEE